MLDKIGTQVPSDDELDGMVDLLVEAGGRLDSLEMILEKLGDQPDGLFHGEPLTAEEAWRLVRAAEACGWRGEKVREQAERVKRQVHRLYEESVEESVAA